MPQNLGAKSEPAARAGSLCCPVRCTFLKESRQRTFNSRFGAAACAAPVQKVDARPRRRRVKVSSTFSKVVGFGATPQGLMCLPKTQEGRKTSDGSFRRGLRFRFGRSWARATGTQDPSSGALVPSGHRQAPTEPAGETSLNWTEGPERFLWSFPGIAVKASEASETAIPRYKAKASISGAWLQTPAPKRRTGCAGECAPRPDW